MEEVDKIILQSLISVGCEINTDVKSLSQLDQDLFIESVAKLLNAINSGSETLPTKLPPNTGVKYRICTKFANVCQQLGYKQEIGYQTFLYTNENDMRRLLMFLSEKLSKDMSTSASGADNVELGGASSTKKSKNLNLLIAQQLKKDLNKIWIPPYCKLNSLRVEENGTFTKEGCKYLKKYSTFTPIYPKNYMKDKSKFSPEMKEYFEKHLKYVVNQSAKNTIDVLVSLMQENALERLNEQAKIKRESIDDNQKEIKKIALNNLKKSIKDNLKLIDDINGTITDNNQNSACLSKSDLAEIELSLQSSIKHVDIKGSRFTHSEKLQFTKEDSDQTVTVSSSSEEKKDEEIKSLKDNLENLNKNFENLESELKKLNGLISKLEQDCVDQEDLNKKLLEKISVKQKTVNLINDAPTNILKLNEEINNHENKMNNLRSKFEVHKKPLDDEKEALRQILLEKKEKMQQKKDEIKSLRVEIDELNEDLTAKENLIKELNIEMENIPKQQSTKFSNRQFYTKRILEIVANIDKQKKEIDKILIETKSIQKEINQLSGKLERIFNAADELIFKDAKKDETNKKVYKLFISINDNYDQLIKKIEESSHLNREIKDLEDQVNSESQNKVADNMNMVLKDYKQIKEENEQLIAKLKANKN